MIRYKRSHFIHIFALERRAKWKENYNFHLEKIGVAITFLLRFSRLFERIILLCSAEQRINYSKRKIKYSNKLYFFSRSIFKLPELSMKVLLSSIIWNENLYMNMFTDCMNISSGTKPVWSMKALAWDNYVKRKAFSGGGSWKELKASIPLLFWMNMPTSHTEPFH